MTESRDRRSVRIPSAFTGLYGFRPSYNRVPYAGCVNSLEGQEAVLSVLGPMTTSIEGIKRFMKAVLDAHPWNRDPMILRMPWNESAYKLAEHGNGGQLCFGILWHDGVVHPHPPVTRALEIAKAALLAKGHRGVY
jgi:amidase